MKHATGKFLTLIRHGAAAYSGGVAGDRGRALTESGVQEVRKSADFLRKVWQNQGIPVPDLIYASPARRTLETGNVLNSCGLFTMDILVEEALLYSAFSADEVIRLVCSTDDSLQHLVLIGHNPLISSTAYAVNPGQSSFFCTAGCCTFVFKGLDWISCGSEIPEKSFYFNVK